MQIHCSRQNNRMGRTGRTHRAFLCLLLLLGCLLTGCGPGESGSQAPDETISWTNLTYSHSEELLYAENFSIDYYEGGYILLTIVQEGQYLVVPENCPCPTGLPEGMAVLQQPVGHIYLAATAVMDLFCALDGLDSISLSGTKADGWYIDAARQAMEDGSILYAGKYSAPDYELILDSGCALAIESTMIYHTPEVKENLEQFGIPVLVDRSSYEPHPLGRTEWIRLYGAILGKQALAETLMQEQVQQLAQVEHEENTEKTVGFFFVTSRGTVNVRKSGDYISKMLELAGGRYLFPDLGAGDNALSTVNMQMEEFYAAAQDADILIYNSSMEGPLRTLDEFLEKCPLLKDSRAVQNGAVWCTNQNMFQESMHLGDIIYDLHTVIMDNGDGDDQLTYLYRLQ